MTPEPTSLPDPSPPAAISPVPLPLASLLSELSERRGVPPIQAISPACLCGGRGYVQVRERASSPPITISCDCRRRALRTARRQRWAETPISPVPSTTFASFDVGPHPLLTSILETCRDFAHTPAGWLVLTGIPGSGKTHLAAAMAHALFAGGVEVLFAEVSTLLDWLRLKIEDHSVDAAWDAVKDAEVLILDDFGVQVDTPWACEKLFQLINARYLANQPTVITSNNLAGQEPRVMSRIGDRRHRWLVFPDVDYRRLRPELPPSMSQVDPVLTSVQPAPLHPTLRYPAFLERQGAWDTLDVRRWQRGEAVLAAAQAWAEQPTGLLVLRGPAEVGKTRLAAAISNHVRSQAWRVGYFGGTSLLDLWRQTFNPHTLLPEEVLLPFLREVSLLVIDGGLDGPGTGKGWAAERLPTFLEEERLWQDRPVLLTVESAPSHPRLARLLRAAQWLDLIPVAGARHHARGGARQGNAGRDSGTR